MGGKWTVPYGLYRAQFHYSAALGRKTGVTTDDLAALYRTLLNMFDHDRTATRGVMALRGLYVFNHADAFGNAPAQSLLDRIRVERLPDSLTPRSFTEYKITTDVETLPDGITVDALHG